MANASKNMSILSQKALYYLYWAIPSLTNNEYIKPFDNNEPINFFALEENFCLKKETYIAFSLKITDFTIRQAINYF